MSSDNKQQIKVTRSLIRMFELFLANNSCLELEVVSIPILDYETELFDIVIRELKTENVRIVMNVCKTEEVLDYYSRLLVRQVIFPIDEIFVYDCQKDKWITNNYLISSYSRILKVKLSNLAE